MRLVAEGVGMRLREVALGSAGLERVALRAVGEHLGVGVERGAHGGERDAVVGLERCGLAEPLEPVVGDDPHVQQLA